MEYQQDQIVVGGLHLWAFLNRDQILDENLIELNNVGTNDQECPYCKARNFKGERLTDKLFSICCSKGKVVLEDLGEIPQFLQQLFCPIDNQNTHLSKVLLF